ncbi:HNH endonuclease [Shewanella baltica]|uniref:HNH endonuclease n=1 Tax=Shewanella baltica TaxID=62322 RepID=UPI00217CC78B|nr:HNH endonuclease signature motif containing protein [Shewanella baltica]MCS6191532.1 HNH endonuclease [Shewanella baltica]
MKSKNIEWKFLLDKDYLTKSINYRACSELEHWRKVTRQHKNFRNALFGEDSHFNLGESNHSTFALFNRKSILHRERVNEYGEPKFVVIWDEKLSWATIINGQEIAVIPVNFIYEIEELNLKSKDIESARRQTETLLINLFSRGIKAPFDLEQLEYTTTNLKSFKDNFDNFQQSIVNEIVNNTATDQLIEYHKKLENEIIKSQKNRKERLARLDKIGKIKPERIQVTTYVFKRNPDVIAEALYRADGRCENDKCQGYKAFNRRSNGSPYLEVHHINPLSVGGLDIPENTIVLCPNCHREKHFG